MYSVLYKKCYESLEISELLSATCRVGHTLKPFELLHTRQYFRRPITLEPDLILYSRE